MDTAGRCQCACLEAGGEGEWWYEAVLEYDRLAADSVFSPSTTRLSSSQFWESNDCCNSCSGFTDSSRISNSPIWTSFSSIWYAHRHIHASSNYSTVFAQQFRCLDQQCVRVVSPSVDIYFMWRNISVLSGRILTKHATNIRHVSGNCWKGFQGQRSKVKVMSTNVWML